MLSVRKNSGSHSSGSRWRHIKGPGLSYVRVERKYMSLLCPMTVQIFITQYRMMVPGLATNDNRSTHQRRDRHCTVLVVLLLYYLVAAASRSVSNFATPLPTDKVLLMQ
jgi:hypothetical protein